MKKLISLLLVFVFAFSFSACKDNSSTESDKNTSTVTQSEMSGENDMTESELDSSQDDDASQDTQNSVINSTPTTSVNSSQTQSSHTHSWEEATCKAPKTCSVCKATEGEKGDHSYKDDKCIYCEKIYVEPMSYINYRGYNESLKDKEHSGALSNTYKKLNSQKEVNVVYFGGSVTYGYGSEDANQKGSWRVRVGEWLASTFPKVKINNINRAIGDTGTNLGLFRLTRDVISQKPDLLFIEFSINDYYEGLDYISSSTQFETIIRNVKEALPECDIVTILVTDRTEAPAAHTIKLETGKLKAGELHIQAKAHEYISKKYNISSIHVGRALADEIFASGGGEFKNEVWSEYVKDGVHPRNKGYEIYFNVIKEFLTNALLSGECKGCKIVKQKLPQKVNLKLIDGAVTFLDDNNPNVTFTNNNGAKHSPESDGSTDRWESGGYKGVINFPNGSADTVSVKFTGTELVMIFNPVNSKNFSKNTMFEVSIDGGKTWRECKYNSFNHTTVLKGLASKEYTAIIRPARNSSSPINIDCFYSRNAK